MIDFRQLPGQFDYFFMRHGKSTGNAAGMAQGQFDTELTKTGREEAARAARWFEDKDIEKVLTSSLRRAEETAEIVAAHLGLDGIDIQPELMEIDIGLFSGLRWDEIEARHPQEQRSFYRHWWDGVPGAEPSEQLYERGEAVWRALFAHGEQGKRRILAVTHSGLLQWIVKTTMGNRSWFPILPMGNCSVYHLAVNNRVVPASAEVDEETWFPTYRWRLMGLEVADT